MVKYPSPLIWHPDAVTARLGRAFVALSASPRRQWCTAFVIFAALSGAWALATPLFASPDEPAHVIRAASVARGQLLGRAVHDPRLKGALRVDVPAIYTSADSVACFAFRPETPASCARFAGPRREQPVVTNAGKHPPLFYALVGWPSLFWTSARGVYAMRLAVVVLTSALLASAAVSLRRLASPRWALAGLAVAVTPTVLFYDGVVNPSGLEIAAGIGLWASGLVLVSEARAGWVDGRVVARVGAAAAVLVLSRQLSPLWLGLIGLALAALGGRAVLQRLARVRLVWLWAAVVGVCTVAQLAWLVVVKPLEASDSNAIHLSHSQLARAVVGRAKPLYLGMIGHFGWLDTPAPFLTHLVWTAAVFVLVGVAIALSSRAGALVLGGLVGTTALLPLVSELREAPTTGLFWQGRYTLPLAVGIPLVAAWCATPSTEGRRVAGSRLAIVLGGGLVVAHALAFAQALRRYTVGYDRAVWFWIHPRWEPPVPALALTIGFVATLLLGTTWLLQRDDGVGTPPRSLEASLELEPAPPAVSAPARHQPQAVQAGMRAPIHTGAPPAVMPPGSRAAGSTSPGPR